MKMSSMTKKVLTVCIQLAFILSVFVLAMFFDRLLSYTANDCQVFVFNTDLNCINTESK